jgi:hypothetical protein
MEIKYTVKLRWKYTCRMRAEIQMKCFWSPVKKIKTAQFA